MKKVVDSNFMPEDRRMTLHSFCTFSYIYSTPLQYILQFLLADSYLYCSSDDLHCIIFSLIRSYFQKLPVTIFHQKTPSSYDFMMFFPTSSLLPSSIITVLISYE